MTFHNPISGNNPRLSSAKSRHQTKTVLTPNEWGEMHDALTLALDALGDRPEDVDYPFLLNCIANQRIALRIAHGRMQAIEG